ncbi:MAG: amidohydrolase [Spirochaetaceae bacterium]|nr:MAG: amidohydrolase [Spirochaetaceae bacterium]
MSEWLVGIRRELHRTPELGNVEFETAARIELELNRLGVEYERTDTAIVGLIRGERPGRTVALRADIDALPINEQTGLSFASAIDGKMHACGHDAHTAILLGAARWFAEHRGELAGAVKLLFQPAEETVGGAEPMIARGCMENPSVDCVFGLHVMPYLPVGRIETRYGTLNGCSTSLTITVHGKGGHGAYPETGVDAVLVASHVVVALNNLVSRVVSPLESAVITVGTINGGTRSNIIADRVTMSATLRAANDELRDRLVEKVHRVVSGVTDAFGATGEVAVSYGYVALVNHAESVDLVTQTATELLGPDSVVWKDSPSMGVEDFSFFLLKTPGAFYHLGCATPGHEYAPLHSGRFVLNEACLPIGVAMQVALTLRALGSGHATTPEDA